MDGGVIFVAGLGAVSALTAGAVFIVESRRQRAREKGWRHVADAVGLTMASCEPRHHTEHLQDCFFPSLTPCCMNLPMFAAHVTGTTVTGRYCGFNVTAIECQGRRRGRSPAATAIIFDIASVPLPACCGFPRRRRMDNDAGDCEAGSMKLQPLQTSDRPFDEVWEIRGDGSFDHRQMFDAAARNWLMRHSDSELFFETTRNTIGFLFGHGLLPPDRLAVLLEDCATLVRHWTYSLDSRKTSVELSPLRCHTTVMSPSEVEVQRL